MKKIIPLVLLILTVVCTATACADNSTFEGSADSTPAAGLTQNSGIVDTETVSDTTADTAVPSDDAHYFQFPLTDANDTTSYVSVSEAADGEFKILEFLVLPTDTDTQELTDAFRVVFPDSERANIQVISFKAGESYGFIYMMESAYIDRPDGIETQFVRMECAPIWFRNQKTETAAGRYYVMGDGGGSANFQYTAKDRKARLASNRMPNITALDRSESVIEKYNDPDRYEFTIVYSYVDGVETINTPVESIPEFPFTIFNEYGFDN